MLGINYSMPRKSQPELRRKYADDDYIEIGIDEAGRGPMFGRVYAAAVVLPQNDSFKHCDMKDSKRFHSEKKINAIADYIKANAVAWSVAYSTEAEIDEHNIRKATHMAMHKAIKTVIDDLDRSTNDIHLIVDGNDFTQYTVFDGECIIPVRYTTVEKADNLLTNVAAASILAKVERDTYITELCKLQPELDTKYGLLKNKGYGTKQHMDGILEHGTSKYHRHTFGICKNYAQDHIDNLI
jgi:ribonuclease HII